MHTQRTEWHEPRLVWQVEPGFLIELQTPPNTCTKRCKVPALLQTCTHAYNIPTSINTTDTNKSWPHMTAQSTAVPMLQHKQLMFTHTHTYVLFFLLHVGVPTSSNNTLVLIVLIATIIKKLLKWLLTHHQQKHL